MTVCLRVEQEAYYGPGMIMNWLELRLTVFLAITHPESQKYWCLKICILSERRQHSSIYSTLMLMIDSMESESDEQQRKNYKYIQGYLNGIFTCYSDVSDKLYSLSSATPHKQGDGAHFTSHLLDLHTTYGKELDRQPKLAHTNFRTAISVHLLPND